MLRGDRVLFFKLTSGGVTPSGVKINGVRGGINILF